MSYSFANQKLSGFLIFKKKKERNKKAYSGQWHLRSLKSITPWDLTHLSQCPCTLQNCEVLFQDHHHCRNAISLISSMKWNHFQVIFLALEKSQKPLGVKSKLSKGADRPVLCNMLPKHNTHKGQASVLSWQHCQSPLACSCIYFLSASLNPTKYGGCCLTWKCVLMVDKIYMIKNIHQHDVDISETFSDTDSLHW